MDMTTFDHLADLFSADMPFSESFGRYGWRIQPPEDGWTLLDYWGEEVVEHWVERPSTIVAVAAAINHSYRYP